MKFYKEQWYYRGRAYDTLGAHCGPCGQLGGAKMAELTYSVTEAARALGITVMSWRRKRRLQNMEAIAT